MVSLLLELDQLIEAGPSRSQPGGQGVRLDAGEARHLGNGEALELDQREDEALAVLELLGEAQHLLQRFVRHRLIVGSTLGLEVTGLVERFVLAAPRSRSALALGHAQRDARQPGLHGRVTAELSPSPMRDDEDVLGGVVDRGRRNPEALEQPPHGVDVRIIESPELEISTAAHAPRLRPRRRRFAQPARTEWPARTNLVYQAHRSPSSPSTE